MLIARLIADTSALAANLDRARTLLAAKGISVAMAETVNSGEDVVELQLPHGDPAVVREVLDECFAPADLIVVNGPVQIPHVFVSDMDSTMIAAECIDELADYAGIKEQIAQITERAMQGELDFAAALVERVALLKDLGEDAIQRCLSERIAMMPGARALVATLKAKGCYTVLVTGGLVGGITDSNVKRAVLLEEMAARGAGVVSLAMGDGANDIPMLEAATMGVAYHAKPKARAAAHGWIDRGDLTSMLSLLGIPREEWVWE